MSAEMYCAGAPALTPVRSPTPGFRLLRRLRHERKVIVGLLIILLLAALALFGPAIVPYHPDNDDFKALRDQLAKAVSNADFNGVKIHYIDRGAGVPIVLLHGGTSNLESWITTGAGSSQSCPSQALRPLPAARRTA